MKTIKTFLIFLLSSFTLITSAQTSVPGGIVSGTWALAGSPYNIQGSIQIANGTTLTIEPGVIVNFQGAYKLNVQGKLLATGTQTDSITFTATNTTVGWKGIRFDETPMTNDTSKILFCKFLYGKASGIGYDNHGGALFFKNFSKAVISHCSISNCEGNNGGGIYCFSFSNINICYNKFSNNTASYGGAIYLDGCNPDVSNNIISNNTAGYGGGIYFVYCNPTLNNNTICNNSASYGGALCCRLIGHPTCSNTILWGNTASTSGAQVFLETEDSDPDFYYCNIQGGSSNFGLNGNIYSGTYQNNLNSDPLFVAPSGGSGTGFNGLTADWSLQNASSCIDSGDPNGTYPLTDIAGNPRVNICRIDIGAFEFQMGIPFQASINITHKITCHNTTTGEITALASGGTLPYTYQWSNGASTETISNIAAGNYAVIISDAGGCSLTRSINLIQPEADSVFAGYDKSIVCGDSVQLNAETKWKLVYNTTYLFRSIHFPNETTGYAVADNGFVFKTMDKGNNWNYLTQIQSFYALSVFFTNANIGYVVGDDGKIYKTIDGGYTWVPQTSGSNSILYNTYFTDLNTGYIAVGNNYILKTIDGGINWTKQFFPSNTELTYVFFTSNTTGFVSSADTIYKTIDAGNTWLATYVPSGSFYSMYFPSPNVGYAVGYDGIIAKTSDAGNSWTIQYGNDHRLFFNSVYFTDTNTGYAVGNFYNSATSTEYGMVFTTNNGGNTWLQSSTTQNRLMSVYFADSINGYAVSNGGKIYKAPTPSTSYLWAPATGLNNPNIINPIANPTITTTYTVTITNINGCSESDNITVIVNPLTVDAGLNKTIICGDSVQLNCVTNNIGNQALLYNWAPINGLNFNNISNPKTAVTQTTKYYVTVTSPNGCYAIDSVTVLVYPLTANAGMDKTIICGSTAQLDNVTSNYSGTGILSYSWSPSFGLNYNNIPNPTASVLIDTKFYVSVSTLNGCSAIDSVNVFVNPLTANAGMDKTITCGGTTQLDYVTSNYTGTGTLSYNWAPAIGLDNTTLPNPTSSVIQNTIYYVTVSTPNGCIAIDSIKVLVNPLTIHGTDQNIICGGSAQLTTNTNYTGTGTLTYAWSPATGLSDTTIANPYATVSSNQLYSVSVTTASGCAATDNLIVSVIPMTAPEICIVGVDSANKNIIVWNKPPSFAIDSIYIYRETGTTNIYQKIGSVSNASLSVFTDTTSFPNVQSNKYKISVYDDCDLESAKSDYHKTMHLAINQGMGNTWNLIWEPYEGFTVSSYRIYRGTSPDTLNLLGTTTSGSTQYTDQTPPSGHVYYQVEVLSPNFCNPSKSYNSSRSNIASNNPSEIQDNSSESELFTIYPNPANEKIEFSVVEHSQIQILNIEGQILKTFILDKNNISIDISGFASGLYFVKVQNKNGIAVKKFVKE